MNSKVKIILNMLLILGLVLYTGQSTSALPDSSEVNLHLAPTHQIRLSEQVKQDKKSLLINEDESLLQLADEQKQKDLEDLDKLWHATVEKNTLIQFTIKKLAVPENERRIHSSFMAKSLSALVSGASFLPSFAGMNYSVQTASFATGKLVNNLINKKNMPQTQPLTDTELIELAGMIETLQDNIINSYYNYKGALNELKQIRSKLTLYNKNCANALQENNRLEIVISSALYDNMLVEEYRAKEQAKKYQMELERLTSPETVKSLNLYAHDISNELLDEKLFNSRNEVNNAS